MRRERFGPTGHRVARVGQGTWNLEQAARDDAVRTLRRGLDLGMTHVDTAEMYGDGAAETLVGAAIEGRRDEVFLVSKVLPTNASRRGVVAACERSLRRLGTDRLDLYLLHWRGAVPLADTVAGLEDLRASGKIAAWGVSNFDVDDLDELVAVAGAGAIGCNQVLYHLRERTIELTVLPWCERHGVPVVAYSPFGQRRFVDPNSEAGRALAAVAAARDATPRQVALAFLTRTAPVFAIPKASSVAHVEENAGAGELVLSDDEVATLDRAFPRPAGRPSLPML